MKVNEEGEKLAWNSIWKNYDHANCSRDFLENRRGKVQAVTDFIFLRSKITVDSDCNHEIKRHLLLGRKAIGDIPLLTKVLCSQSYYFPSSHVRMWELDHKEALKNWCFWIAVLLKTPKSPLDCKEIVPVNPKGNQHWIFIGRTDAFELWC